MVGEGEIGDSSFSGLETGSQETKQKTTNVNNNCSDHEKIRFISTLKPTRRSLKVHNSKNLVLFRWLDNDNPGKRFRRTGLSCKKPLFRLDDPLFRDTSTIPVFEWS